MKQNRALKQLKTIFYDSKQISEMKFRAKFLQLSYFRGFFFILFRMKLDVTYYIYCVSREGGKESSVNFLYFNLIYNTTNEYVLFFFVKFDTMQEQYFWKQIKK